MTINPGHAADLGSDQPYPPNKEQGGYKLVGGVTPTYITKWDFIEITNQGVPTTSTKGMGQDDIQRAYPCQDTTDLPGCAAKDRE